MQCRKARVNVIKEFLLKFEAEDKSEIIEAHTERVDC